MILLGYKVVYPRPGPRELNGPGDNPSYYS